MSQYRNNFYFGADDKWVLGQKTLFQISYIAACVHQMLGRHRSSCGLDSDKCKKFTGGGVQQKSGFSGCSRGHFESAKAWAIYSNLIKYQLFRQQN